MTKKYFILMGDIIGSHKYKGEMLSQDFRSLVNYCNNYFSSDILSPYTITLGDEFQGVAKSLTSALKSIFYFEETILKREYIFKVRYVLHYGDIETQINKQIAHGMMGKGLATTRKILSHKGRERQKFYFDLTEKLLNDQLNRLFSIIESFSGKWQKKDYLLISDMLSNDSNKDVGAKHGKNRSQIWKRRKHLYIEEYKTVKAIIFDLIPKE